MRRRLIRMFCEENKSRKVYAIRPYFGSYVEKGKDMTRDARQLAERLAWYDIHPASKEESVLMAACGLIKFRRNFPRHGTIEKALKSMGRCVER